MAVTQADLESRLASAVPARNGIPGSAQYTQAVNAAVADLSRRSPMQKVVTLAIVSGTATYALPADFLRVIRLETLTSADGVLVSDAGLLPVSSAFRERYVVTGTQITFYPTPQYSVSREVWYAAAYVPDAGGVYQEMSEAVAAAVLLNFGRISKYGLDEWDERSGGGGGAVERPEPMFDAASKPGGARGVEVQRGRRSGEQGEAV